MFGQGPIGAYVAPFSYPEDAPCWNCGQPRRAKRADKWAGRGLCGACNRRWHDNGYQGDRPPAPRDRQGWENVSMLVLEDFARLDGTMPTHELVRRFGKTRRTLTRWRRRIEADNARTYRLATAARACGRDRWRAQLRPTPRPATTVEPTLALFAAQSYEQIAARSNMCHRA
jgi:hypothetical protein